MRRPSPYARCDSDALLQRARDYLCLVWQVPPGYNKEEDRIPLLISNDDEVFHVEDCGIIRRKTGTVVFSLVLPPLYEDAQPHAVSMNVVASSTELAVLSTSLSYSSEVQLGLKVLQRPLALCAYFPTQYFFRLVVRTSSHRIVFCATVSSAY
jgi:hypothetical protein